MAYPIIENPINDNVGVAIAGNIVNSNLVSVSGSFGAEPDAYYSTLQPALCTVELYDLNSTQDAFCVPGAAVIVNMGGYNTITGTFEGTNLFYGKIRDVDVNYEWDAQSQKFIATHILQCVDFVSDAGNVKIPQNAFSSQTTGEQATVAAFGNVYTFYVGTACAGFAGDSTLINQFVAETDALTAVDTVARSINKRAYSNMLTGALGVTTGPTETVTYSAGLFTDGTHNPAYTGLKWGLVDIDYGYSSKQIISEVTLNNTGLNRAPKAAGDVTMDDVTVGYTATQSVGVKNKTELETIVNTDNLGWNFVSYTGCGKTAPGWTSANYKFGTSNATTLNGHAVGLCTVSTAHSSASIFLMGEEYGNNFVTSTPGGATGSWNVQFKAKTVTASTVPMAARIIWYNTAGTVLRTDTGTSTAVNNSTWTTVTYTQASPPAGAAFAQAVAVVNGSASVGYQFYMTEVIFTRTGTSATFFDGDTADNSTYAYGWTGTPGASPSQKVDAGLLSTLATNILARNTAQKRVKTVTFNAQENPGTSTSWPGAVPIALAGTICMIANEAASNVGSFIQVCINGVTGYYKPLGYTFEITPTSILITLVLTTPNT